MHLSVRTLLTSILVTCVIGLSALNIGRYLHGQVTPDSSSLIAQLSFDQCIADMCSVHDPSSTQYNSCVVSCFNLYHGGGIAQPAPSPIEQQPETQPVPLDTPTYPVNYHLCVNTLCARLVPSTADYMICISECAKKHGDTALKDSALDSFCGDGFLQTGEECDDGNLANNDGCDSECNRELNRPTCGNGVVEIGEECDDGNRDGKDGCSVACRIEVIATSLCGNSVIETGEYCDDGNAVSGDGCSAVCTKEMILGQEYCFTSRGDKTNDRSLCGTTLQQQPFFFPQGFAPDRLAGNEQRLTATFAMERVSPLQQKWDESKRILTTVLSRIPTQNSDNVILVNVVRDIEEILSLYGDNRLWSSSLLASILDQARQRLLILESMGIQTAAHPIEEPEEPDPQEALDVLTSLFQKLPSFLSLYVSDVANTPEEAEKAYELYGFARDRFVSAREDCEIIETSLCEENVREVIAAVRSLSWMSAGVRGNPEVLSASKAIFADLYSSQGIDIKGAFHASSGPPQLELK